MNKKTDRIASIDVFRALTMLLMIWVNDFWTLENVPKWLEHAAASEDYLGFSDLIFPWFLFIVGLSIPFAIENRIRKGDSRMKILYHILLRSFALLVMGIFHVNLNSLDAEATGLSRAVYTILCTSAFFMVWNVYPKKEGNVKWVFRSLQLLGVGLMVMLAIIYSGNSEVQPHMTPKWWGILGLIGWTYLLSAPAYLFLRKYSFMLWVLLALMLTLNIISDSNISYNIFFWQSSHWLPGNGGLHVFAFGGIVTALLLKKYSNIEKRHYLYSLLLLMAITSLGIGFILHKYFIISKIQGTSTWVMFCTSTAFLVYAFLHWLVDHLGKANWFKLIKVAGTATLTCYLVPYFYYSIRSLLHIELDGFLIEGIAGLTKSLVFAFIVVGITRILGMAGIRLKI